MSKQRQNKKKIMGCTSTQIGDTTYTKLFIGGLAWATQTDSIVQYFNKFGEIVEAVVIFDKRTGKSKGYGFVTFKDPESAMQACENPNPIIDGRKTNCNLAAFGSQKPPSTLPTGLEKSWASLQFMASPPVSTYICQNIPEFYTYPYFGYRYNASSSQPPQDMLVMNYENGFGGSLNNNEVYVGYYMPIFTMQGQSSQTKWTENPSQGQAFQPLYGAFEGPQLYSTTAEIGQNIGTNMAPTSKFGVPSRHDSSA